MDVKNTKNFIKFLLDEGLAKYIKEVEHDTKNVNFDAVAMKRFLKESRYDVTVFNGNDPHIQLKSCIVEISTKPEDGSKSVNILGSVVGQPITMTYDLEFIKSGSVKFVNTHYSHQDQTDMIIALLSDTLYAENKYYRFNVEEFKKIPEIDGDRYIFIRYRNNWYKELFSVRSIADNIITLEEPHSGQCRNCTPLQFLVGMRPYPVDEVTNLKRTDKGLLISPIGKIIPIMESDPDSYIQIQKGPMKPIQE